jgi:hypothetical protein
MISRKGATKGHDTCSPPPRANFTIQNLCQGAFGAESIHRYRVLS